MDVVNSKGEALVLNYNDFYHVKMQLTTAMYAADKPYLDDVQVAQFEQGSVKLFWKKTYNDEECKIAYFLQKKAEKDVKNLFPPVEKPRGIITAKKENIKDKLYVRSEQKKVLGRYANQRPIKGFVDRTGSCRNGGSKLRVLF